MIIFTEKKTVRSNPNLEKNPRLSLLKYIIYAISVKGAFFWFLHSRLSSRVHLPQYKRMLNKDLCNIIKNRKRNAQGLINCVEPCQKWYAISNNTCISSVVWILRSRRAFFNRVVQAWNWKGPRINRGGLYSDWQVYWTESTLIPGLIPGYSIPQPVHQLQKE